MLGYSRAFKTLPTGSCASFASRRRLRKHRSRDRCACSTHGEGNNCSYSRRRFFEQTESYDDGGSRFAMGIHNSKLNSQLHRSASTWVYDDPDFRPRTIAKRPSWRRWRPGATVHYPSTAERPGSLWSMFIVCPECVASIRGWLIHAPRVICFSLCFRRTASCSYPGHLVPLRGGAWFVLMSCFRRSSTRSRPRL